MGGIALLARSLGHTVTGSDQNVYPPMSDTLKAAGVDVCTGYQPEDIKADLVIIGNGVKRDNACVDFVMSEKIPFISGPQWIDENILRDQHVLAVAGTHGKTTTTALLTWILESAGLNPGFLIGGVPKNFDCTARLGGGKYFVIEADEYDTVFYDKRAKFMHYHPSTLIVNNIEFDHADIFDDLEAIKKQFQFLLRTVPSNGSVIFPSNDKNIKDVVSRGAWGKQISIGDKHGWHAVLTKEDGSAFECYFQHEKRATISWSLIGEHNVMNALVAIAAADEIDIAMADIEKAFATFENVKRRMEVRGTVKDITVYDDFAHHPTAIATTIAGLRQKVGDVRIIAIAQLGSNTMSGGTHKDSLANAFLGADRVHVLQPDNTDWDVCSAFGESAFVHSSVSDIIDKTVAEASPGDQILVMSNKGFDGIHDKLLEALQ